MSQRALHPIYINTGTLEFLVSLYLSSLEGCGFEFQVSEHILDLCVNSLNSYGINERPLFSFDAREIIPLY